MQCLAAWQNPAKVSQQNNCAEERQQARSTKLKWDQLPPWTAELPKHYI